MSSKHASRVQALFLRAIALPPEQRSDWIDANCGSDEEVRSELVSLLEHHRDETLFRDLPASSEVPIDRTPSGGVTWRRLFDGPWRPAWVCAALLLFFFGVELASVRGMERLIGNSVGNGLEAVLSGYEQAVERWVESHKREAQAWAQDPEIALASMQLIERGEELLAEGEAGREELRELDLHLRIRERLQPLLRTNDELMYTVLNRNGFVMSSIERFKVQFGLPPDERTAAFVAGVFQDNVRFIPPTFFDEWFLEPVPDELVSGASTWCAAPIHYEDRIVGVFSLGLPAAEFDRIFETGDFFPSGDVYTFDAEGVLVSEPPQSSRLIPEQEGSEVPPYKRVRRVRDPGGDTTADFVPTLAPEARPLTALANAAITSRFDPESEGRGQIMQAYRDYRGVPVVGAWRWMADHGIGLATELDSAEAYQPVAYLRRGFQWLYLGLGLALLVSLGFGLRSHRARRGGRSGVRLGAYTLIRPIGEGGVGRVYLASHALLRRESAVKLLREDQLSNEARTRFEREVQLASGLEHPNTIQIHDYGHTGDGTFYYAMEYLKGENLAQLVEREGPMDPVRVVHVLRQVCGSLREAHDGGLVHRDIKPQNVMLVTRAGIPDVIKVLDFGLAKDLESSDQRDFTRMARISGTPLYMAPERIRDPRRTDARVDIYAVGALAYFLLTGERMFAAETDLALIEQVLRTRPAPVPTGGSGQASSELAQLIALCLEKDPDDRPRDMAEVLRALRASPEAAARSEWAELGQERPGPALEHRA